VRVGRARAKQPGRSHAHGHRQSETPKPQHIYHLPTWEHTATEDPRTAAVIHMATPRADDTRTFVDAAPRARGERGSAALAGKSARPVEVTAMGRYDWATLRA
jgi:hypothetical protein